MSHHELDYRALFESVAGTYLVLSQDLVIVAASDSYLRDTAPTGSPGTGSPGTGTTGIIGKRIFDVLPGNPGDPGPSWMADLRTSLDRVRRERIADTMPAQSYPSPLAPSAGGGFEVRYRTSVNSPVFGADGRLACILHQITDTTEHVRLGVRQTAYQQEAEELRQRAEQAETDLLIRSRELRETTDAKTGFIDQLSHELRTPLNTIIGFGELLRLDETTAEHREWISMMLGAARHLTQLLDQAADMSRIEARKLSLTMEAVPVHRLISEVLQLVQPLALSRGVHLDPPPAESAGISQYVHADDKRLRQVLLNLLSNAIKYNHPAGQVTVTTGAAGPERLRISITDTGRGIANSDIERLFQPFERLDAAQAGIEGTGLGLALSRDLIEAMGGTTGAASTAGSGSVFWVELPATEPLAVTQTAIETDTVTASREYDGPRTVLYVEDMVENLRLVEQILRHRPSVTVMPAMLAGVALDLARQYHPDLILLDLRLPDMPGEEVLSLLRADPGTCDIPVIILTAVSPGQQTGQVRTDSASSYLTKPITVHGLLQAVDTVLGARTATEPLAADGALAERTATEPLAAETGNQGDI